MGDSPGTAHPLFIQLDCPSTFSIYVSDDTRSRFLDSSVLPARNHVLVPLPRIPPDSSQSQADNSSGFSEGSFHTENPILPPADRFLLSCPDTEQTPEYSPDRWQRPDGLPLKHNTMSVRLLHLSPQTGVPPRCSRSPGRRIPEDNSRSLLRTPHRRAESLPYHRRIETDVPGSPESSAGYPPWRSLRHRPTRTFPPTPPRADTHL